jgi:hypothetical protein
MAKLPSDIIIARKAPVWACGTGLVNKSTSWFPKTDRRQRLQPRSSRRAQTKEALPRRPVETGSGRAADLDPAPPLKVPRLESHTVTPSFAEFISPACESSSTHPLSAPGVQQWGTSCSRRRAFRLRQHLSRRFHCHCRRRLLTPTPQNSDSTAPATRFAFADMKSRTSTASLPAWSATGRNSRPSVSEFFTPRPPQARQQSRARMPGRPPFTNSSRTG